MAVTNTHVGHGSAILTIILFFLSNLVVIFPIRLPIPTYLLLKASKPLVHARIIPPLANPFRRRYIPCNFITAPLASVLILLAAGAIDGNVIRRGIVGADGIRPINIMALFISLAYIALSLDFTGLLRFCAFWVARKGGSSGRLLFFYLYVFFLVCGVIVGNDPVILSGTAFLAYFTRVTGITPPTAWIFSQFAAANIASVVLVSSNPTNLVLSGAFSLSFISYTAHVVLPFLAAAVFVFPVLAFGLFRSPGLIPASLEVDLDEDDSTRAALVDKSGAIFGSVLLAITLAVLVGTSTVGVPVWEVTVPPAIIMLLRDAHHDWRWHRSARKERSSGVNADGYALTRIASHAEGTAGDTLAAPERSPQSSNGVSRSTTLASVIYRQVSRSAAVFPTVSTILRRLPISLLPFAFLMFILVQGLSSQGWVEVFAAWWGAWVKRTGTLGAIGGMGFVSCLLCNVCGTNIGATILLARVIQLWLSSGEDVHPRTRDGTIYALALGSNYGAFTLTFSASLAGLLWRQILLQKSIRVRSMQFLLFNLPIAFVAMLTSCAVLVGQVYVLHRTD